MTNGVSIDPETGTVTGIRKLRESGNSVVLTIPKQVLETAGMEAGETVTITANMSGDTITIEQPDGEADE
jgi:antitoxin component of MazEF toxin-antitoxin module